MNFSDNFLRRLSSDAIRKLEKIRDYWEMPEKQFTKILDSWFSNFESESDKKLAMKVVENIQYFSKDAFDREMTNLYDPIDHYLQLTGKTISDLIVLVPDTRADSADRHAYDMTKHWLGLQQKQVITLTEAVSAAISKSSVLVAFNDTHGTGNQFVYDIWNNLTEVEKRIGQLPVLFVAAMTISEKARNFFDFSFADHDVIFIPEITAISAKELFTAAEYDRLEELCSRIYPLHRMGYGDIGLLTAYYFQCPNNSLPIIWANGTNNEVKGYAYRWKPLFPYLNKAKGPKPAHQIIDEQKFINTSHLPLAPTDEQKISNLLLTWGLESDGLSSQIIRVNQWFDNFSTDQKALALALLFKTRYLSLQQVRSLITKLGKEVLGDILAKKRDKTDILLVLTGYDQPSIYHHVFDFLKYWGLKIAQAVTLEELKNKKYLALNKSLVYFYHTRGNAGGHFIKNILPVIKELPTKEHYVLSFAMSSAVIQEFSKIDQPKVKCFYAEEISQTAGMLLSSETLDKLSVAYETKTGHHLGVMDDKFLTAYYFGCPKASIALIGDNHHGWAPLFKR